MRYIFVAYVVAEVAAFWAMVHFLGFTWALVITLLATGIGYAMLGRRARALGTDVRRAMHQEIAPGRPLTDSALFGVAALLTILPGAVSTIVGLVLMTRPVRTALAPVITAEAARRAALMSEQLTVVDLGTGPVGGRGFGFGRHEYVDGTVNADIVDTTVRNPDGSIHVDTPRLPPPTRD